MPKPFRWFIKKKLLLEDKTIKEISNSYLEKAKNNIITMELLGKATNHKDILELPDDYDSNEWIVIVAYYSMYMSALSVLAKLGYKSKNHSATIMALEEFFIKKKLLKEEYLKLLEKIKIKKEEIEELNKVKNRREIAQYSVTKETAENIAKETKEDAHKFVDKMEELLDLLGKTNTENKE
jgi:uncharacterized protein (UPF0332 family)